MANPHNALSLAVPFLLPAAFVILLGGCAGSSLPKLPSMEEMNPFAEKEKILPGKRVSVMPQSNIGGVELASADRSISLPAPSPNQNWSQPGGNASNSPGHVVFEGSGRAAWTADIGTGSSSRMRLTSSPVVADGRVYAMDAESVVSAYNASSGSRAWRVQLAPENERAGEGFGGGIALDGGRLYAATGFGTVVGLDPGSGKILWQTKLGVPLRASPTAFDGQVFVVATDGRAFNLNGTDGAKLWTFRGLPQTTGLISNPSPAVHGNVVVFPFPNGDIVGVSLAEGLPIWSESVATTQTSSLGAMRDASRPVVSGGRVYAVGHSGRMVAADAETGERIWASNVASIQPPAVAGSNVFVVDLQGQLMSLDVDEGQALWQVQLAGARTWSGPVLASGRLWLTSDKGQLVGVDATTGRTVTTADVGDPIYLAPIVAGGTLFVLTDRARLIAYR